MTALRHHPHGETLMSHTAGTLDPALSVVLRCHLRFCERRRAHLFALDMSAGPSWKGSRRRKTRIFSLGLSTALPGHLRKKRAVCCLP